MITKNKHQWHTYLSINDGRTISGLIKARCWRAEAASKLPNLLKTESITAGLRHSTNFVRSSSVSFASSGIGVSQVSFLNFSLRKVTTKNNVQFITVCVAEILS